MNDKPIGQRFSHVYVENSAPTKDSTKARHRIQQILKRLPYEDQEELSEFLRSELGVFVDEFSNIEKLPIVDFLDAITLIYQFLANTNTQLRPADFQRFCERVFKEENIGYSLDEQGGVHFLVDSEFSRNIQTTVAGLGSSRFIAASRDLQKIQPALDANDLRLAVRVTFDGAENIFKVMLGGKVTRLGTDEIKNALKPAIATLYDPPASHSTLKLLDAFAGWVAAAHFYRHAEGAPDPPPPPAEIAILLVSQGAAWVRWLAELDNKFQASAA
ncbi:MAG: hypothetical protein V4597_15225 [Pseudomonadota bacterium]